MTVLKLGKGMKVIPIGVKMDPRIALIDYLESVAAFDLDGMESAHESLTSWVGKRGFIPESIHAALDALRFADTETKSTGV